MGLPVELIEFSLNRIFDLNRHRISLTDRPLHLSLQHLTQPLSALSLYAAYNVKGRRPTTLLPPPPRPNETERKKRKKRKAGRGLSALCKTLNFFENNKSPLKLSYLNIYRN